ncbi:MAG: hypothetical protein ACNS64_12480 [Candidatus Halalkalibacterium sp. M3_1C_030]
MQKTFNRVDEMPINQKITTRPSISIGHLIKQLDEINRQYHDFNRLTLSCDKTGQKIRISYVNEDNLECPLMDWLNPELVGIYLKNYQRMFCMDTQRLDRFFDLSEAAAIVPITWLRTTRKRKGGISNAFFYMKEAYRGLRPKRTPILIQSSKKYRGQFDILDGNSTVYVARKIGMKSIPVKLNIS